MPDHETSEAYVRALYRIEQLLVGSAMSSDDERIVLWRDWAVAIADEWNLSYDMRRHLMESAHEQIGRLNFEIEFG